MDVRPGTGVHPPPYHGGFGEGEGVRQETVSSSRVGVNVSITRHSHGSSARQKPPLAPSKDSCPYPSGQVIGALCQILIPERKSRRLSIAAPPTSIASVMGPVSMTMKVSVGISPVATQLPDYLRTMARFWPTRFYEKCIDFHQILLLTVINEHP